MAHICPNKDLKIMKSYSPEEVTQKIQHYENKMAYMSEQEQKLSNDRGINYDNDESDMI